MIEACAISNRTREINYIYPLWLRAESEMLDEKRVPTPNLDPRFLAEVAQRVGLEFRSDGSSDLRETFGPEDVFFYIYAVLSSPAYRGRYGDFLKADFPRVPVPGSRGLLVALVEVGARLTQISLMEGIEAGGATWRSVGGGRGNRAIEVVRFQRPDVTDEGQVWINEQMYFDGVPSDVWGFSIGGYCPAQKWLKDRRGRTLDDEDIAHYRRIVAAIEETIERMQEVDEIIEAHGGWPTAFEPTASSEESEVLPFQRLEERPRPAERYRDCVPLVPLAAAAGAFGEPQFVEEREEFEWVRPDTRRRLWKGMFVAQVVGKSMEPRIPNGAWCLFRSPVTGTRQGRTLLVQLRDAVDPETDQRYTVKRYESRKVKRGDSWRHERIRLLPLNPEFDPIEIRKEEDVEFVAELVEVLGD